MNIIKLFKSLDWTIIVSVIILMTLGVLFIYSSGVSSEGVVLTNEYIKQIIWAISGILILIAMTIVNPRRLFEYAVIIYVIGISLLIYTRLFGKVVHGAKAWLGLAGDYGIQPSEFMKIATALLLAKYLEMTTHNASSLRRAMISFLIIAIPMGLILIQPDFGTALVFMPLYIAMAYFGNINKRYLAFLTLTGAFTILLTVVPLWHRMLAHSPSILIRILHEKPFLYYTLAIFLVVTIFTIIGYKSFKKNYYYWIAFFLSIFTSSLFLSIVAEKILKEYQIMRLIIFLDPTIDPLKSGWNIIQSITAIGSGGLWGKGFLNGTQSHYRYLPEQSTDFIFSIMSEELGFFGGIIIFALFLYILIRLALSIKSQKKMAESTFTVGIFTMILFHFVINAGMTMGIMPITGIPLLFLSYGGSSLWAICIGLGIALGIGARKFIL